MLTTKLIEACGGKSSSRGGLNIEEFKHALVDLFPELQERIARTKVREQLHEICREKGIGPAPKAKSPMPVPMPMPMIMNDPVAIKAKPKIKFNVHELREALPIAQARPKHSPAKEPLYSTLDGLDETYKILLNLSKIISTNDYSGRPIPTDHPLNRFIDLFKCVISGEVDGLTKYIDIERKLYIIGNRGNNGLLHLKAKPTDPYLDFIPTLYSIMSVINKLNDHINTDKFRHLLNSIMLENKVYPCLNGLTSVIDVSIDKHMSTKQPTFTEYINEKGLDIIKDVCISFPTANSPEQLAKHLLYNMPQLNSLLNNLIVSSGLTKEQAVDITTEVFREVWMFEDCETY